jgi:trk system potassium uptake protein TrkA
VYIVIVGGGKVGFYLAKELVEAGHEALVIEQVGSKVAEIAETLGEIVMRGDGCEAATLKEAGTERADLFLAVTGEDEANLVACQVARHRFNVRRVVARINNPKNEAIFRKLGIDVTVSATSVILSQIEQELPEHPVIPLLQLRHGFEIVEVKIPETARSLNMKLSEVQLPPDSLIWGVVDVDGNPQVASGDTLIRAGEEIVAVTRGENKEALKAALTEPR